MRRHWLETVGAAAVMALGAAHVSCSSAKKIDGETHFLCAADSDCVSQLGSGYGCVRQRCEKVAVASITGSCRAGTTSSCVGVSGCTGTKTCSASGAFGPCECLDAGFDASDASLHPIARLPDASGCRALEPKMELLGTDIYVLLDQSEKMNDRPADSGETWWQGVQNGMAAFLTNMASTTRLEIGIQFFPLGTAPCQADYATPEVELMPLATGAAVINAAIAAHSPSGLAATGPALESAIAHMKAVAPTHPNEVLSVSLVTESRPADCQPSAIADLATIAASGMAADPRVRTFVIALGEASTLFDPVARAGGTSASIVVPSDNISSGVNDALSKVFFPQEYCAYDIASLVPPGATLDPNLVSVSFPRGLPDGGTIEAPLIQNPSDCASAAIQRNGWSVHPFVADTIVLCGWSCMHFSADVRIAYGCR